MVEAVLEDVDNFLISLAESVYSEEDDPVQAIRTHIKAFLNASQDHQTTLKHPSPSKAFEKRIGPLEKGQKTG